MKPPRSQELTALINDIEHDRIERARRMTAEEKLLAGYQLFQRSVQWMRAGIRADFPHADDDEVTRILRHRLDITHHSDERPI